MKPCSFLPACVFASLVLSAALARAEDAQLSPENLDALDHRGFFPPSFKTAVRDLVDMNQSLEQAKTEQKKLREDLPDLQKQATAAEAKVAALRQELDLYEYPDETDFNALQRTLNDPAANLPDQIALAQAFVWAYPASPHQSVALQYLQQCQKKLADREQAEKDAETARVNARAQLIQRAQARDLSLSEWRSFLRDMAQDELLKYLGHPDSQNGDLWTYAGDWTVDPASKKKVGLAINFSAGRVLSVSELPH